VLLGFRLRLHPKTSNSLRLRLQNPGYYLQVQFLRLARGASAFGQKNVPVTFVPLGMLFFSVRTLFAGTMHVAASHAAKQFNSFRRFKLQSSSAYAFIWWFILSNKLIHVEILRKRYMDLFHVYNIRVKQSIQKLLQIKYNRWFHCFHFYS